MTDSTIIYANTLAQLNASKMDGERLRRVAEAPNLDAAFKMLFDYGYTDCGSRSIDDFIITQTNELIDFVALVSPSDDVANALNSPFWYNNAKLAYKSKFIEVPKDGYYKIGDPEKIAKGDYSECDKFLEGALCDLDERGEKNPREIDLSLTRAMYKNILSCKKRIVQKYFKTEIDLKNILTAARLRRLNVVRDEFILDGTIKRDDLMESLTVKNFSGCFMQTIYSDIADEIERDDFNSLPKIESEADDHLFYMTDGLCAKMSGFEPFLNYYTRTRVELKAIRTALVCIKTDSRDAFFSREPKIYE